MQERTATAHKHTAYTVTGRATGAIGRWIELYGLLMSGRTICSVRTYEYRTRARAATIEPPMRYPRRCVLAAAKSPIRILLGALYT